MERKECKHCKITKPLNKFSSRTRKRTQTVYHKPTCKACVASLYKKNNPEGWKKNQSDHRERYKAKWGDIKKALMEHIGQSKCLHCKIDDLRVLHFHHREPETKKFMISTAMAGCRSLARLKKEAEKCDLLCANCHLILHHYFEH